MMNIFFKILLLIIFIGIFTPASIVARFLNYNPLQIKARNNKSYWQNYKSNFNFKKQ